MSFPTQAQTINICDRTQQVQDAILRYPGITSDTCDNVSVSDMASIFDLDLSHDNVAGNIITSLEPGDFDGLPEVRTILLDGNNLTRLQTGTFRGIPNLNVLNLATNSLSDLPSGIFSGLPSLFRLNLLGNPGTPFKFTVRFEPETLEEDFTTTSVRLVLREGAPRTITVPLLTTGGTLSVNQLTLTTGSTQSAVFTVTRPAESKYFRLSQGHLELGGLVGNYLGLDIVRGSPIEIGEIQLRVRVFLEGALE